MYRYIALVWRADQEQIRQAAHVLSEALRDGAGEWRCAFECTGMQIYVANERMPATGTMLLPNRAGAILGTLFSKQTEASGEKSPTLTESDHQRIAARGIPELLSRYWGRYVAILRDTDDSIHILRDPSGILPTLHTTHREVHIVFSDLESVIETLGLRFSINWKYIEACVTRSPFLSRETGLLEVSELLPGQCLHLARGTLTSSVEWNPFDVDRLGPIEALDVAAERAYHTLRHCVSSWAQLHDRIVHRLSGGLDSSIVAACIAASGHTRPMTCLTYHDVGLQEDERFYARLMAAHLGVNLIEYRRKAEALDLQRLSDIPRSPRPYHYLFYLEHVPLGTHIAQQCGASAIVDGLGGDTLFHQSQGALGLVDRIIASRACSGLLRTALDAAQMDGRTIWSILRTAFCALITRDKNSTGPWNVASGHLPPGKLQHILSTATAPVPFYEPFSTRDAPDSIHPLLSQPIIELFYRIPIYVLIDGGWDRAVVRRAFVRDVPPQIIRRRSKGASSTALKKIFQANRPFFADLLLNGELVKRGLLQRPSLASSLSGDPRNVDFATVLVNQMPLQMWLNKWINAGRAKNP